MVNKGPAQVIFTINQSSKSILKRTYHFIDSNFFKNLFILAILISSVVFPVLSYYPPSPLKENATPRAFSAERAMKHLCFIALQPRPCGSEHHSKTRDYIFNQLKFLGLNPQFQQIIYPELRNGQYLANIIAFLPGTTNDKAILFMAHYDSVPESPGANDNAAAVSALLELARVLKASPPLKKNIIFLFTDGEEIGSLGADAFVRDHPWSKKIDLVFNFEARGSRGPVIMFETQRENGWIIAELARCAPWIITNSFIYEVYRKMPLSGDFSIFKDEGFAGLNFAYIEGSHVFHQPLDNIESVSKRSLQNHGQIALTLAKHFGEMEIQGKEQKPVVYFNFLPFILLYYPETEIFVFNILGLILFLFMIGLFFLKKYFSLKEFSFGLISFGLNLSLNIIVLFLSQVIFELFLSSNKRAVNYKDKIFFFSFILFSLALFELTRLFFPKKCSRFNFNLAWLFPWFLLTIISWVKLPSANFIFLWPLILNLICLNLILLFQNKKDHFYLSTLLSSPFIFPIFSILWPVIYLIFSGLTMNWLSLFLIMFFTSFARFFLSPLLNHFKIRTSIFCPIFPLLIGLILFIYGLLSSQAYIKFPAPPDFNPLPP